MSIKTSNEYSSFVTAICVSAWTYIVFMISARNIRPKLYICCHTFCISRLYLICLLAQKLHFQFHSAAYKSLLDLLLVWWSFTALTRKTIAPYLAQLSNQNRLVCVCMCVCFVYIVHISNSTIYWHDHFFLALKTDSESDRKSYGRWFLKLV